MLLLPDHYRRTPEELTNLGVAEIERVRIGDEFILGLNGVACADLKPDPLKEDTLFLETIAVHEDFRGYKYGSFLFDESIDLAKHEGYKYFSAKVHNERIAAKFSQFEAGGLFFEKDFDATTRVPLDISLNGVRNFLTKFRQKRMPRDAHPAEMLHTSIRITGDLGRLARVAA